LRHHIHKDLKQEYHEVRDSLTLWLALEERFGKQKTLVFPQARRDGVQFTLPRLQINQDLQLCTSPYCWPASLLW
jgi:hypothetical protein